MPANKIKHPKANVAPAAIKTGKKSKLKQEGGKVSGFFGSLRKELYPVFLACMTTAVSVFIAKMFVPYVYESIGQEDALLLDQPHWEAGTTAFIEFTNPRIEDEREGFAFFVKTPYVSSFDITSFDNHKFSLDADRTKNLYSSDNELQFPALLAVHKSPVSQISSPIKLKVSGVYKDDIGMGFRLQAVSSREKKVLQEMVRTIRQNPRAKITLMFDFIDSFSVMDQHLGIISDKGEIYLDGSDVVYEAQLKRNKDVFNDKGMVMYGLGEQSVEYIFNNHPDYQREQKILDDHDLSNQFKPGAIIDEVNAYAPKMVILGAKVPLVGTLNNLEIKDGVLRIRFQNNYDIPKAVLNRKISPTIVLDYAPSKYLQKEYRDTGYVEKSKEDAANLQLKLVESANNNKIIAKMSWFENMIMGYGDYGAYHVDSDKVEDFFVGDIVHQNQYVAPLHIKERMNGLFLYHSSKNLSLACCYNAWDIKKDKDKLTMNRGGFRKDIMENGNKTSIKGSMTALLWSMKKASFSGLHGRTGVLYKKNDEFYLDVILSLDNEGKYNDIHTAGFYVVVKGSEYYAFNDKMEKWGVGVVKNSILLKDKKDLLAKDHKLGGVFDFINNYSSKAIILMNQKQYYVRLHRVEAGEDYIRFKLSYLNEIDPEDVVQKGRFTILFEE